MKYLRLILLPLFMLAFASASEAVVNSECEFVQGSTTVNQGFLNCDEELRQRAPAIASVAALRALTTVTHPGATANLLSWTSGQRLGGGLFEHDAADTTSADNSCTIFVDASSRRWKRHIINNTIAPEDCGADLDPLTSDTTALQAAIDYRETVAGTLRITGKYLSTATLAYVGDQPITIIGSGNDVSQLIFDISAGSDGLTLTFSGSVIVIPEISNIAILTKKDATITGTALEVKYTVQPPGSNKGIVIANNLIQTLEGAPSTTYWTYGIELTNSAQSFISNNFIKGQAGVGGTKIGAGILCHTWCNGTSIISNKIRGWANGFLAASTFADATTFQIEGVSFIGNTFQTNNICINYDLWDIETASRVLSNVLDCSSGGVRFKNVINSAINDNQFFWSDQVSTPRYDILLITTNPDVGGAPQSRAGIHSVTNNAMSREGVTNVITNITQANPAVVTYSGDDNWINGAKIFLTGAFGMAEVKHIPFTVANVNTTANTFSLRDEADTADINSTAYSPYTSGGEIEGFSVGIEVQGGNTSIFADNNIADRSIGIRLGSLVTRAQVERNLMSTTFIDIKNNMTTIPEEILVGRTTDADVIEEITLGNGLEFNAGVLDFEARELNSVVWGTAAGFTTMRFDAGAADPVFTFSSGGNVEFSGEGSSPQITFDDQGSIRFNEEDANGNNGIILQPPAAITATQTCTFENDASFIPDSCVGDGVDDGAGAGGDNARVENGDDTGAFTAMSDIDFDDGGDINFARAAGPPDVLTGTVRANSVDLGADTTGNYADGDAQGGAALTGDSATAFFSAGTIEDARIDGTAETDEVTAANSTVWGTGTFTTERYDTGAIDPVWTYSSGTTGVAELSAEGASPALILDDEGEIRFKEEDANGNNSLIIKAPAAVTASQTCTFEDDASFIPDACVGDGVDAGGASPFTRVAGASGAAGADVTLQRLTANCAASVSTTAAVCMTTTGVGAGVWNFKYVVRYQSSVTTTGVSFSVNHTGTTGAFLSDWKFVSTGTSAATGIADQVQAVNAGTTVEGKSERVKNTISSFSAGVDTINVDMLAILEGMIVVTVSGSLELKHATEIGATSTQVMDDTHLILTKVE